MRLTDEDCTQRMIIYKLGILFCALFVCNIHDAHGLFQPGKEYVYSYSAKSSSGVLLPSQASSTWGFHGKLIIQTGNSTAVMQLQSLKTNISNGKEQESGNDFDVSEDARQLTKPFEISYNNGLVENFSVAASEAWSINIKRSIAGIMQLDLSNLGKYAAYHSDENNHYGQCNMEYVINPEGENEILIRKFLDPRTCRGYKHHTWSNVAKMLCPNGNQHPVLKSSERIYRVRVQDTLHEILSVKATGGIYVQPFQSLGEAQFHFTRQTIELISVEDIKKKISTKDMYIENLQHELPETDLTQGRGTPNKSFMFKTISNLLDRMSQQLENPGLDTNENNLHNTTVSVLLYYLGMLDVTDLRTAYNKISGTSYKEETIRNMFLETLPQVGTKEAAMFILELIQSEEVSEISAIQLLTQLPFHIRKPDVELLVSLQTFLNLPEKVFPEVQNTAILTYGTLIYKTCLIYCPYEMLDDYVRLYLDKFTETAEYEKKMIWLEGLSNIQLGRVVEFLEPIASGSNAESRHFRVLAAWASLSTAPLRPDVIYPVYWPILVNRTEHLEMRVAALTLLIISSPTPNRLISLYWYMQSEPSQHLYHYFYTTLKSMERTTHPCYVHIGGIAAQFTRVLRQPSNKQYLLTGNYLFDYQDTQRKFGAMIHSIVIANPLSNIPEVLYVTLNTYGSGTNINHVSLYVKAEGLLHSLSTNFDGVSRVKDLLDRFKLNAVQNPTAHLELIARIQDKTVLCLHLNETNIAKGIKYLTSLPENIYHIYKNMEFHVNQQRVNVPLIMESVQVTDMGTNARLAFTTTSLFSMRGNFTYSPSGRNNHFILRSSVHGMAMIETYNPLLDTWHAAERAQSIHGYLPVNVTINLEEYPSISYNTPGEQIKIGIMGHVRTSTTIRGANVRKRLAKVCPTCPTLYEVTLPAGNHSKSVNIFEADLPELGGQICVNVFNCESAVTQDQIATNVMFSHKSNHEIWRAMQYPLLALHVLDYFTYVPPKGTCGIAAFINTLNTQRTQVKFGFYRLRDNYMFSLTHKDAESSHVLHQWNLAAVLEMPDWFKDVLKIKATRIVPGNDILKICLEATWQMPSKWDFLSMAPSDPTRIGLDIIWGLSDTAKGKCSGSLIRFNIIGDMIEQQIAESQQAEWPYDNCRADTKHKHFVPFTDACYEASKELSTLRKYQAIVQYHNLPEPLINIGRKLRAIYDLAGGNSSASSMPEEFVLTAKFPKDSNTGELSLNRDKIAISYNYNFIDFFLIRTRVHKYIDSVIFKTIYSTCVVTPDYIKSVHNVIYNLTKEEEVLVLGQCNNDNPRYALTARSQLIGVDIGIYDERDTIHITPHEYGAMIQNNSQPIIIKPGSEIHSMGPKRIRFDGKSVDLELPNIHLFMHWTHDQTLLFFPRYILEFSCGVCTRPSSHNYNLNEKV